MLLVDSPTRRLSEKLLSTYLSKKFVITGTIIHCMKNTGVSLKRVCLADFIYPYCRSVTITLMMAL